MMGIEEFCNTTQKVWISRVEEELVYIRGGIDNIVGMKKEKFVSVKARITILYEQRCSVEEGIKRMKERQDKEIQDIINSAMASKEKPMSTMSKFKSFFEEIKKDFTLSNIMVQSEVLYGSCFQKAIPEGSTCDNILKMHRKDEKKIRKRKFIERQKRAVKREKLRQERSQYVGMSDESIRVSVLSTWLLGAIIFLGGLVVSVAVKYKILLGDAPLVLELPSRETSVSVLTSTSVMTLFGLHGVPDYMQVSLELVFWFFVAQQVAWFSSTIINVILKICEFFKLFARYRKIKRVGPFGGERKFKRFVDDMCLMITACDFKDPTKVVALLVFTAKQFTEDDSIIERITVEIRKLVSNSSNDDRRLFGALNRHYIGMASGTDELKNNVSDKKVKLKALWRAFRGSNLGTGICKLLLIMVTTGALPEFSWDIAGVEIYSLQKTGEVIKAVDLFDAVDKTLTGVAEGVARYEATGKFESFFSDDSLEYRVADAIAMNAHIATGSIEMYANMTEGEYADLIDGLHHEVKEKMKSGSKSDKFYFKPYLDKLAAISQNMHSLIANEKMKKMPYAVLLIGNSGTGKSHAAEKILHQIMLANGVKPDPDKIITVNSSSNFDDEVLNKTVAAIFDDLGNAKPKSGGSGRSVSEIVIKYLNNVSQMAYKADVDSKNAVRINIDYAVGTTNVEHLNTASETNNRASIKRRFKLDITMYVKPMYCINESTAMDEHLVEQHWSDVEFPPVHYCKVERTLVTDPSTGGGNGYRKQLIPFNDKQDWWELADVVRFVKEDSVKHMAKQNRDLSKRKSDACDIVEADLVIDETRRARIESLVAAEGRQMKPMMFKGMDEKRTYRLESDPPLPVAGPEPDPMARADMHAVLERSPELMYLVRCGMSWKHYFFFTWTPYFIQVLWVRCGCKLSHFVLFLWFVLCPTPILMIVYGGFRVRSFGMFLIVVAVMLIKDLSLNMLAQTMFRSAVDRRTQAMWQVMVDDIATTHFVVKLASAVLLIGVLRSVLNASSISYTGLSIEEEKTVNASAIYKKSSYFIANTALGKTMNMTDEQMINAIKNNVVRVYAMESGTDNSLRNTGGFFIGPRILAIPLHFKRNCENISEYIIEVANRKHFVTIDWNRDDVSGQYVEFEQDFVAVALTGIPPFADVSHCFSQRTQKVLVPGGKALSRLRDGLLQIQRFVDMSPSEKTYTVGKNTYKAIGYHAKTELPMQDGSCMTVVIKESPSPEILGFHIAGVPGQCESLIHAVTQQCIASTIENLTKLSHQVNFVADETLSEYQGLDSSVHALCPTRLFSPDFPVNIYGSIPGTGPRKMKTEFTPFHDEVAERLCGVGKFGIPKGRATREDGTLKSPWKNCVEEISEAKNLLMYSKLSRAAHLILEHFRPGIKKYVERGLIARPLTLDEATNGIPGMLGANGVNINTSAGIGFGKTKKDHVLNDEHPWIWKENVVEKVEYFISCLSNKKRPFNVLNASLKDEPLKAKKVEEYKTRVFFCDSLDALLVCMMWFTAPCNFMSLFNGFSHCALGLNTASYDWDWVYRFMTRADEDEPIPDDDFICLDFKGFDKTLPESLMFWAWWLLIQITCEMPGYTPEIREKMSFFALMKCTPYIAFNGTLLQFFLLHTSGNGCTAHVGSLAGLLLIVMICIEIMEEQGVTTDIWHILRSIHLGDDCVISIRRSILPQFHFLELQERLAKYGIKITPADKEAEPTMYQNVKEYDFLKRQFVFCEDRQSMVGPLDKVSFVKALGFVLPSKKVSRISQYGATFNTVMFESALHGREFFHEMRDMLKQIADEYGIHSSLLDKTYEEFVVDFAVESGRRYPKYRQIEKPVVEKAFRSGNFPDQWQKDALGKVVKKCIPDEPMFVGMSGEVHIHINILCCFRKCCRTIVKQRQRAEEVEEDSPSSNGSGSEESKNRALVLDNAEVLKIEENFEALASSAEYSA